MLKLIETDGGKLEAGFTHETNDCAVRALALAANIPYAQAHALMKAEGRRDRKGTKTWMTERALAKSGAKVTEVILGTTMTPSARHYGYGPIRPTLADMVRKNRTGRYLVIVRGHALAVIDSVIHDAGEISDPRCRVKRAFRVTLPEPEKPKSDLSQTEINAMWERLQKIKF